MASDDFLGGGPLHCEGVCRPPGMAAHLSEHPEPYAGCFMVVALGVPGVAAVLGMYVSRIFGLHFELPTNSIVRYTLCAVMAPVVFLVAKVLAVVAPRWWALSFFISACYESATVLAVLRLICTYLGGPNQDMQVLERGDPIKVWALCPICCPCLAKRTFDGLDLSLIRALVLQRVLSAPLAALMDLLYDLSPTSSLRVGQVEVFSQLLALYALLVLLRVGESTKERHRATLRTKLWTLMCVLLVNTAIFRAFSVGVPHFATGPADSSSAGCLRVGGGCYRPIDVTAARAAAATAALLVPLAVFLRQAFPLKEVENAGCDPQAMWSEPHSAAQGFGPGGDDTPVD